MHHACMGVFLYYSCRMKPLFEKQRVKAVCPDDGKIRWWVALYKSDGELYFWCIHDKPAVEKEVVNRKRVLK